MFKTHLRKADKACIVSAAALLLLVSMAGWMLIGEVIFHISLILSIMMMLIITIEIYRRLCNEVNKSICHEVSRSIRKIDADYRQIEALFSIFSIIKVDKPLPSTRVWAASPDLLKEIVSVIFTKKPELVVEASSGVSTLIIAYCLKQIGKGKVISLEHDPTYAALTQDIISSHNLTDIAKVVHAPLTEVEIDGASWLWYNMDSLNIEQTINLLVIDGPPGSVQHLARYPALPLLFQRLDAEATIILDDGNRRDEKEIIKRWNKEFNYFNYEYIPLEKGAFVIANNHQRKFTKQASLASA